MDKIKLAYIAGIVDGEGYIGIKKSKAYKCQGRKTPGYHARLQIRMVHEDAIKFIADTLGGWYYKENPHSTNGKPLYCYQSSDKSAENLLRTLLPYLKVKKQQAHTVLVLVLRRLQKRSKSHRTKILGYRNFPHHSGKINRAPNLALSDEYVGWCERLYQHCKSLNN